MDLSSDPSSQAAWTGLNSLSASTSSVSGASGFRPEDPIRFAGKIPLDDVIDLTGQIDGSRQTGVGGWLESGKSLVGRLFGLFG